MHVNSVVESWLSFTSGIMEDSSPGFLTRNFLMHENFICHFLLDSVKSNPEKKKPIEVPWFWWIVIDTWSPNNEIVISCHWSVRIPCWRREHFSSYVCWWKGRRSNSFDHNSSEGVLKLYRGITVVNILCQVSHWRIFFPEAMQMFHSGETRGRMTLSSLSLHIKVNANIQTSECTWDVCLLFCWRNVGWIGLYDLFCLHFVILWQTSQVSLF